MTIQMSSELNHLFAALSKLQGKIEKAKKDQAGYKNNYKFADLSQYIDLSQDLLAEYGLCVLQMPGKMEIVELTKEINNDFQIIKIPKLKLITWIGHESGQFISGPMEILVEKLAGMSWGQSVGSAITYARRYVRAGSLGMSQEDDDNQNKSNNQKPKNNVQTQISHKVGTKEIEYLKEIFKERERLKKILEWARVERVEDITMDAFKIIENKAQQEKAQEKSKEKEKLQENVGGSENNLVSEIQANFIKRIVTPERLVSILRDHKITRLEEMNLKDYHALNDTLRIEGTPLSNLKETKVA